MEVLALCTFVAIASAASISRPDNFEPASTSGTKESPEVAHKLFPFLPYALLALDFLNILDILTRPKPKPKPSHYSTNPTLSADDLDVAVQDALGKVKENCSKRRGLDCLLAFQDTCLLYAPWFWDKAVAIPTQMEESASQSFHGAENDDMLEKLTTSRAIEQMLGEVASSQANAKDFEDAKFFNLKLQKIE